MAESFINILYFTLIFLTLFLIIILPLSFMRWLKKRLKERAEKSFEMAMGKRRPVISVSIPWDQIKGEFCRVKNFLPLGKLEGGKIIAPPIPNPYAILDVENPKKLPSEGAFLPIAHKIDFKHLWEAFRERGIKEDEEVLLIYHPEAPSNVPKFSAKIFELATFPKFRIWICKKGLLEKLYDKDYQKKVGATKFFTEEVKPIKEWTPFQEVE